MTLALLQAGQQSGSPTPAITGIVVDSDDPADAVYSSGNWATEGAGTTWTFGANSIHSVGVGGTYSSLIRYTPWHTLGEEFTIKARVVINAISASEIYFGVGLAGVSTFSQKMALRCALWANNSAAKGLMEIYYSNSNGTNTVVASSGAGRLAMVAGDTVEYEINQSGFVTTFTTRNITTPAGDLTCSWNNSGAITYPGSAATLLLNVEQLAVWNYRGDYTLTSLKYYLNDYSNIKCSLVGDSKSEGYYVNAFTNRISNILAAATGQYIQVAAGSGNVTQDILNCMPEILLQAPQKVVLFVGRNDIANGVAAPTYQANYASIVTQLTNAGIDVWHQLPLPETVLNQAALTTYINATYPANRIISVPAGWNTGTDCSPDGIHLTIAGSAKAAANILPNI